MNATSGIPPTASATAVRMALASVRFERLRQDAKWGEHQRHTLVEWLAILSEEHGELAREILRAHFGQIQSKNLRAEAVQVAAVAVAIIEAIDAGDILP